MTNNEKNNKCAVENTIFEECNFDVDIFIEKHGESRKLVKSEAKIFKSFCETAVMFKLDRIILGSGRSCCKTCIFKTNNSSWVIWETDERRGFYNALCFDNIYDACQGIFRNYLEGENVANAIKHFNMHIDEETPEASLIDFASKIDYTYTPVATRKKERK